MGVPHWSCAADSAHVCYRCSASPRRWSGTRQQPKTLPPRLPCQGGGLTQAPRTSFWRRTAWACALSVWLLGLQQVSLTVASRVLGCQGHKLHALSFLQARQLYGEAILAAQACLWRTRGRRTRSPWPTARAAPWRRSCCMTRPATRRRRSPRWRCTATSCCALSAARSRRGRAPCEFYTDAYWKAIRVMLVLCLKHV